MTHFGITNFRTAAAFTKALDLGDDNKLIFVRVNEMLADFFAAARIRFWITWTGSREGEPAPLSLGRVHGSVSTANEVFARSAVFRIERHADTRANGQNNAFPNDFL